MKQYIITLMLLLTLVLGSCGNSKNNVQSVDKVNFEYASGLKIEKFDGYTVVTVADPWKEGHILQNYVLVPRDSVMPSDLPEGTVVRVPLQHALVYSSVHVGEIGEITGSYKSIAGVCDSEYFTIKEICDGVKNGTIADCGSSMSPSMESIINLSPDAIILSPFENGGYGQLSTIGCPIIEMADYMESTPLGRAEWMKFLGLLYGAEEKSNEVFSDVIKEYVSLCELVKNESNKPTVITESVNNGVWFVPGGKSYMANLLNDAGAKYVFSDDSSNGSLQLSFEQVFDKAQTADYWLIKTFGITLTHAELQKQYALNVKMKAFADGHIFACDTQSTTLFADFPFHPEKLLKEYISIFHPDKLKDYHRVYYKEVTD